MIGNVPVCVGVPERVSVTKVIPLGRAPTFWNVYRPVPPEAVNVVSGNGALAGTVGREPGERVIGVPAHATTRR